jgi:hypothetical protein
MAKQKLVRKMKTLEECGADASAVFELLFSDDLDRLKARELNAATGNTVKVHALMFAREQLELKRDEFNATHRGVLPGQQPKELTKQ